MLMRRIHLRRARHEHGLLKSHRPISYADALVLYSIWHYSLVNGVDIFGDRVTIANPYGNVEAFRRFIEKNTVFVLELFT